ncbi:hypothetical protein LUZ63_017187 [Rhynchospora breviuscula]|uniref:Receptor-like serine/threonine-protein kinase n=1 Tax=Rhynchospora breviuscula TaxID=2022672 RepID=A0A9Q0HFA9_9POAL|nr:hypothetical protein LUZ63_017187 [Rhynchospora breviuscula]
MNAITANQPLSGDQKITSENETFILGFFKPGNSSNNWYIGIWYGMITEQTVVWVANRETPITNTTSSELTISDDGNLVLINQFKTVVWSTNVKGSTLNSTHEAVILDSGNLVLRDKSNSSRVLWESFDHPAHTWLAGSKIGLNKTTGVNQRLISWKMRTTLHQYWKSGKWNGQYFDSIPEMELYTHLSIFSYSFVDDKAGTYLTYWISGNWSITRIVMDISGQLKGLTWRKSTQIWGTSSVNPKAQCDVYNWCGAFGSCDSDFLDTCHCIKGFTEKNPVNWGLKDYSGGCVRSTALQCNQNGSRKGDEDRFYEMSNIVFPDNSQRIGSSNGIKDCESACLNNCSCTAYSYSNGCSLWYGDLINLKDGDGVGGETIYLRLAASELPNTKSKKIIVIVVVCIGVFLVICLAFVLSLILRRRWRLRKLRRVEGRMMAFTYRDLLYITINFSEALGRGGFGSVYKGILPDSTVVAVKRLDGICQGDKNFRAEVSTIGMIQHLNLIRLIGFCSEHDKKLLVYEHMPMGSLDRHLFGNTSARLSWNTRYQIALGISRGLHYLHEKCRDCIIHCDIKPENILLDELFVPKIADFGLAKLLGHDFSRVLTSMRGTIGYLAPEWISGTALTAKADVYSYGMMLLEIIFGKRNRRQEENNDVSFFPAFAAKKLVEGDIQCLLDVNFVDDANMEELERALKVALWCVQWEEDSRPSMGKIVQLLEGLTNVSMPPIPRPFEIFADNPYSINYFSNTSSNVSSN